jgi:hypothetical protein
MRSASRVQAVLLAVAIASSGLTISTPASAAVGRQIHLRFVSQSQPKAMCLQLFRPSSSKGVSLKVAVRAVENLPLVKRSRKRIPINEAALAQVESRDPSLSSSRNARWVLVSIQGRHATKLFFVNARNGHLVTYMNVGDGCQQ